MDLKMLEDWNTMLSDGTVSVKAGILSSFSCEYENCILVIDDSVTEIGEEAFSYNDQLKEIVIPDSVIGIGMGAFFDCNMLENIYGGRGVTKIGESAFCYCINLKNFLLPDKISIIKSSTFEGCEELENIVIPSSVITIEDSAFMFCESLKNVKIPNSVIKIEEEAFWGCTALITLKLSGNIESIEEDAFGMVNNIEYAGALISKDNWGVKTLNGYVDGYAVYEDHEKKKVMGLSTMATEFDIPDSVTEIGAYAFVDCNRIKSLSVPKHVKIIGENAFLYVNNIVYTGKLKSKNNWGAKTLNGYVDGDIVYENRNKKKLTGVNTLINGNFDIPNSVTEVASYSFYKCLENVTIPNSVKRIGKWSFADCQGLKSISISNKDNVETIGEEAFSACQNLVTVTLPNKLKIIETELFFDCQNLKNVEIPESVTEIREKAFGCCYSLEDLIVPDTVIRIGKDAFLGVPISGIIYNGDAVDDYEDSNGRWGAE